MPRLPLVPALLLITLTAACDQLGGGEVVGGMPQTFTITSRSPSGGAAGIPVNATIVVNFNSAIDPSSIVPGVLTLNGRGFGDYSVEGPKLVFTPAGALSPGSTYAVQLSPDIRGSNGHLLGPVSAWGFKTSGSAPPPPDTTRVSRDRPR